jgi:hypothetical protein
MSLPITRNNVVAPDTLLAQSGSSASSVDGIKLYGEPSTIKTITGVNRNTSPSQAAQGELMFGRTDSGKPLFWLKGKDTNYVLRGADGKPLTNVMDAEARADKLISGGGATRLRPLKSSLIGTEVSGGEIARRPSTTTKLPAPAVNASPTLIYTDWNGTAAELVAGGAKVIPGVRNLMNRVPGLAGAMMQVASRPMSNAIRWEAGFATDGKNPAGDLAKPSSYTFILKFNAAALKASPDFGRFTSSLEPVLGSKGVSLFKRAVEATRKASGRDVRLYFVPQDDGGVNMSLGVSTVVVPTKTIGKTPRRVGTAESVPNVYGLGQLIVRVPLNHTSTRPGHQVVLAAGVGVQGKHTGGEVAAAKVISNRHHGGSLGFVQKNGEFGVVMMHQGKQQFVSIGKDAAAIEALTGKSPSTVPQTNLPTLDREQIASELRKTAPRSTREAAEHVVAAAKTAGPLASFAADLAPYAAAVFSPNPLTIGNAAVDAAEKYTAAEKAMTDQWAPSIRAKDFEPLYRSFASAPLEEKSAVITKFAELVRKQVQSGQPGAKATYDAWKRLAESGYPSALGSKPINWDRHEQGFPQRKVVSMSDFADALANIVVNGSVGSRAQSIVDRDLSSITVPPLHAPKAAPR